MKIINISLRKPKFDEIKLMLKDTIISRFTKGFIAIMLIFIIIGAWKWQYLPPQIPLFYSLPRSPDQLSNYVFILFLPIFCIFFFGINFILASHFYQKEKLASIILVTIGTIISFLSLITFIKIIFLVT